MTARPARKRVTAADLMERLEKDPDYVAQRASRERQRDEKERASRQAQTPLLQDLQGVGIEVSSVWDLVNTATPYPDALPILVEHLKRPYPDGVREGIARALAVPDAHFGWHELAQLYQSEPDDTRTKDGLAVALAGSFDESEIEDLVALAQDRRNGSSRILLLRPLARSERPGVREALDELAQDPELAKQVGLLRKKTK
jgi:hypothetical protein